MTEEKFDCIVVGAGPAGSSAAYVAAKAGLNVLLLERGDYPGAKNMMGGVVYPDSLNKIDKNLLKDAPFERNIIRQDIWIASSDSVFTAGYNDHGFKKNCCTVLRSEFDRWYAEKAEDAGAILITGVKAERLIIEKGKVVGVETGEGEKNRVFADAVIIADGVNSVLVKEAGLGGDPSPENVALGVKEVLSLPPELINARFNVDRRRGAAIYIVGEICRGMQGMGFIYTNKNSISIGIGINLAEYAAAGERPYELLDRMKKHPCIEPLIMGGEILEYSAHLIPEGGYSALPKLFADGVIAAGDAAGLVNSYFREGSNLAITSGKLAAETIIRARENDDFSARSLSYYRKLLKESYVLKDLKMFKSVPGFLAKRPEMFSSYPELLNSISRDFLTVNGTPKKQKIKTIKKNIRRNISIRKFAGLLYETMRIIK